jgi:hypothetical protein
MKVMKKSLWSRVQRILLLAAGGATLGFVVVTLVEAVPRPLTIEVRASEALVQNRRARLTLTREGEAVVEANDGPRPDGTGLLSYKFWLSPNPHELELRLQGCPAVRRRVDPARQDRLAFRYSCAPSSGEPTETRGGPPRADDEG